MQENCVNMEENHVYLEDNYVNMRDNHVDQKKKLHFFLIENLHFIWVQWLINAGVMKNNDARRIMTPL